MRNNLARPHKQNDAHTVLYELDMFRFAGKRLLRDQWEDEKDLWVNLECFLLHFRSLAEFLGKEEPHVQNTDVHVSNIWKRLGVPEPEDLPDIRKRGEGLWKAYERVQPRISRYVAHPTTFRKQRKDWLVGTMSRELEPIIARVEKLLRLVGQRWAEEAPVTFNHDSANSTAS